MRFRVLPRKEEGRVPREGAREESLLFSIPKVTLLQLGPESDHDLRLVRFYFQRFRTMHRRHDHRQTEGLKLSHQALSVIIPSEQLLATLADFFTGVSMKYWYIS